MSEVQSPYADLDRVTNAMIVLAGCVDLLQSNRSRASHALPPDKIESLRMRDVSWDDFLDRVAAKARDFCRTWDEVKPEYDRLASEYRAVSGAARCVHDMIFQLAEQESQFWRLGRFDDDTAHDQEGDRVEAARILLSFPGAARTSGAAWTHCAFVEFSTLPRRLREEHDTVVARRKLHPEPANLESSPQAAEEARAIVDSSAKTLIVDGQAYGGLSDEQLAYLEVLCSDPGERLSDPEVADRHEMLKTSSERPRFDHLRRTLPAQVKELLNTNHKGTKLVLPKRST